MRLPVIETMLPETDELGPAAHPLADWWRAFFEASEDALVVCRRDGVILQLNPSAARLFRLTLAEAEGQVSLFKVVSSAVHPKLRAALASPNPRNQTFHGVLSLSGGAPRRLTDLEIMGLPGSRTLLTFKDATPRMRLESHVQRLITVIGATPDVFFLADADFRLMFVNPAFQIATGHGIEEVLGKTDEFLRAPADQPKVRAYLDAVSQGREWIGELTNVRRDGTAYSVEATISPIADMAGRFIGYVACERDITPRKRLEDDLRLERDFVRSILHSLDGAIYTLDREFHLTHANEGWRRFPTEHAGIRLEGPPQVGRLLLDYVTAPPAPPLQKLARGSGRVLVVDDLDLLRDFTRSFLEASGLTVEVAEDGPSALKVLERAEKPMDILFTDYNMPGMDGIALMEAVARRWPHMRLILSSGYLDDSAQERLSCLKAHLLAKPYEMSEASELVMSLLPAGKD